MLRMFRRFTSCRMPYRVCRLYTREALDIKEITYDELITKEKEGAILIDVRTRQEFSEGHLEGAILVPYYDIYSKIKNITQDKEQAIILYCKNGGRSLRAYAILHQLGYSNIYNLKGGIEGI